MTSPWRSEPEPFPSSEVLRRIRKTLRKGLRGLPDLLPEGLRGVDLEGLSHWIVVGLSLFSKERLPTVREAMEQARLVLLVRGMEKHSGNITHVANDLQSSRRSVREHLQQAGIYEELIELYRQGPPAEEGRSQPAPTDSDTTIERGEAPPIPGCETGQPVELMDDEDEVTHPIRVRRW